ncbi:MAG: biotin/lipoyl-binding protein [Chloroflexi bacterium]|nr:MAG: biotin/lipoyl-binding protein [Chloroflexota bacterium]
MRYEVALAGRALRVDLSSDGRFAVDGQAVAADAREVVRGRQWSVVLDGRSHEVTLVTHEPLRLDVDGVDVEVSVVDERSQSARRDGIRSASGRVEIRAPMPGLLKSVHVAEGDTVERDAPLVTLEAMKMENELRSPVRGRVTKLGYASGTKVEGGAVLAVLVQTSE